MTSGILIGLAQLGALWIFIVFLMKDYALDRLRQNLFRIRADLFDKVLAENGSFSDENYLHLRSYINQVIRRGHTVTISRSILANVLSRVPLVTGEISPDEMRADVESYLMTIETMEKNDDNVKIVRQRVHVQLLEYYALTSPIFIIAMIALVVFVVCASGWMGVKQIVKMAFERFLARDIDRGIVIDACGGQPA